MNSMLYTMGMAIDRAAENGFTVSLLIEGQWIEGQVAANDGVGVVLECGDGMHMVAKAERISAVKVMSESPYKVPITVGADFEYDGQAMPMPGPRQV
jgi:hypothetical protein